MRRVPTSAVVLAAVGVALLCVSGATVATVATTILLREPATRAAEDTARDVPAIGPRTTLTTPARIGTMYRSTDQSGQQEARDAAIAQGATQAVAARYEDEADPAYRMSVSGLVHPGSASESLTPYLDEQLAVAAETLGGPLAGHRTDLRPAVGGQGACDEVTTPAVTFTVCAWLNGDAAVTFVFRAYDPGLARGRMVDVLPAVVHPRRR